MKYQCNCCNVEYADEAEARKCDCIILYICIWCDKGHDCLADALCCCKTVSPALSENVKALEQKWIDSEHRVKCARALFAERRHAGFRSQGCWLDAESDVNLAVRVRDDAYTAFIAARDDQLAAETL